MEESPPARHEGEAAIRERAAAWVVRQDRRLTPAESAELETWLQADARHADAFARSCAAWRTFRRVAAGVQRSEPVAASVRSRWPMQALGGLAAAVAIALLFAGLRRSDPGGASNEIALASAVAAPEPANARLLSDGSLLRLKEGSELTVAFTATERRVHLRRGEAFFSVMKDPTRPFLVEADGVTVRAVGTAFTVELGSGGVDVVVAEGTVRVAASAERAAKDISPTPAKDLAAALVDAGERAVVRADGGMASPIHVTPISAEALSARLAWKAGLLNFGGAALREVAGAFLHTTGQRILIPDTALAEVRIGGQFPPDDVEGFLRVVHELHGIKARRLEDGAVELGR
jgi:transmembrane sensor